MRLTAMDVRSQRVAEFSCLKDDAMQVGGKKRVRGMHTCLTVAAMSVYAFESFCKTACFQFL